nr:O-antigen polymerase [uncultured Butyrivibrio sp.]
MEDAKRYREKNSEYVKKFKAKVSDKGFWKSILNRINPEPEKGSDTVADYMTRVLLFLFPLFIYEKTAFLSISMKDMLFGILILTMSIWCIVNLMLKDGLRKISVGKRMLSVFGIFVLILLLFAVQMSKVDRELGHTYLYIGMFLLPFGVSFIRQERIYYMQIFLAAWSLVYISILRYVITGTATILGVETLLKSPAKFIPSVLLCCAISSFLYIIEKRKNRQNIYLAFAAISMVVLFMYGDMAAFMILFLYLMCLQFLRKPTVSFIKRNLILIFAFAFCASNTPLISYFGIKGYTKEFDLEYSIYIDIIIAVAGLFITSYWEKIPKDHDEDHTVMTRFSKWFKRSLLIIGVLLIVSFIFGSRGNNLSGTIGGKAIAGFSTSLWNAVNSTNGEIWHVLAVYGVIGVAILLFLGVVILGTLYRQWKNPDISEVSRGYIMIAVMFLAQSMFFPFSSASTPAYLIFLGLALTAARKLQEDKVVETEIDLDAVLQTETAEEEAEAEKEIQVIWVPQRVKETLRAEQTRQEDDEKEVPEKGIRFAKDLAPQACAIMLTIFGTSLLFMVVFALYRVFVPIGSAGSQDSLVQVAIEHRQEQLEALAAAEAETESSNIEESLGDLTELDVAADTEKEDVLALVPAKDNKDKSLGDSEAEDESKAEAGQGDEADDAEAEDGEETEESEPAEGEEDTEEEEAEEPEAGVSHGDYRIYDPNAFYRRVNETVSGRTGIVNLRDIPRVDEGSVIVHALEQGETAVRTGIGANGWSRVEYGGKTLYAVTNYLTVVPAADEEADAEAQAQAEAEAAAQAAAEQAAAEQAAQEADAAEEAKKKDEAKPKTPTSYSVQWTNDNKTMSIWSAGVLQGSMTVTDGDGNAQKITSYGDYYQGSGKDQKRYLNLYVPQGESQLTINVDGDFVGAVKGMGYSGIYFNKAIHNW